MVGTGAGARSFLSKADRHVALTLRDEIDVELENLRLSTVTDAVADFGLLAAFTCRHRRPGHCPAARWARDRVAPIGSFLAQARVFTETKSDDPDLIRPLSDKGEYRGPMVGQGILENQNQDVPGRARGDGQEAGDAEADQQSLLHLQKAWLRR